MRFTLVADGASDAVLVELLTWSLIQGGASNVSGSAADFSRMPRLQGLGLENRLSVALELYPCDLLFVHRDAEGSPPTMRRIEISNAVRGLGVRHIPVVPVRMTEAWLLLDERAIRHAAGNPNGREDLRLPAIRSLEGLPDPKQVLHEALRTACGLNARRRARFPISDRVRRIPNYVDDYSPLNVLPAFRSLQEDIGLFLTSV